jgi:hypothetical protein
MTELLQELPATPELLRLAARLVWFKAAEAALRDPAHLVAHVLTYGTQDDVRTLRSHLSDSQLRAALECAPAGVFDPRSWAYWNLMLDRPATPLPERFRGNVPAT